MQLVRQELHASAFIDALLVTGVAIADGDSTVFLGLAVDCETERCASLVHPGISFADRRLGVILGRPAFADCLVNRLGDFGHPILIDQWEDGCLDWRESGVEPHDFRAWPRFIVGIRLADEGQGPAIRPRRGLNDVGDEPFVAVRIEVGQVLAASLMADGPIAVDLAFHVGAKVIIAAVGDSLQLALFAFPQEWEGVFDIGRSTTVMAAFFRSMFTKLELVAGHAQTGIPLHPHVTPVLVPRVRFRGMAEELDLHLLELAGAEDEVPRGDFVSKALADLGDAERNLDPGGIDHVSEVHEDALGRFRAEIGDGIFVGHRPHIGFKHQVEFPWLGEVAIMMLAHHFAWFVGAWDRSDVVGPKSPLALAAIDHHVMKEVEVTAGLPDVGVHDNGGFDADHVIPAADHVVPPGLTEVAFEFSSEWAVVPESVDPAIYFTALENEPTSPTKSDDTIHQITRWLGHKWLFPRQ